MARRRPSAGDALRALARGAYLHDVGKVAVADEILNKPGPLTPEERSVIETHPVVGHGLVEGLQRDPLAAIRLVQLEIAPVPCVFTRKRGVRGQFLRTRRSLHRIVVRQIDCAPCTVVIFPSGSAASALGLGSAINLDDQKRMDLRRLHISKMEFPALIQQSLFPIHKQLLI